MTELKDEKLKNSLKNSVKTYLNMSLNFEEECN